MNSKAKIAIVSAVVAGLLWMAAGNRPGLTKLTYSEFLEQVESGQVASVTVTGAQVTGRLKDGNTVRTVLPPDYRDAIRAMRDELVNVEIQDSGPLRAFTNAAPFLLLLGLWIFLLIRKFPRQRLFGAATAWSGRTASKRV